MTVRGTAIGPLFGASKFGENQYWEHGKSWELDGNKGKRTKIKSLALPAPTFSPPPTGKKSKKWTVPKCCPLAA